MACVVIYSDGAASGNPGPGGYGTILMSDEHYKELTGGYAYTTNNRMELLGVIAGLEALKQDACEVTVYSDSAYVVNAVEKKWVFDWERKRFHNKKNADLWQRFLRSYRKHKVKFVWVKGHAGDPLNERCDRLAAAAAAAPGLPNDIFYVSQIQNNNLSG
jgi:ribonuclease HI